MTGIHSRPESERSIREALVGVVGKVEAALPAATGSNQPSDVQFLAGLIGSHLRDVVGQLRAQVDGLQTIDLYQRLLKAAGKAQEVANMTIYMDGGRSWQALVRGSNDLMAKLEAIARASWRDALAHLIDHA